MTKSELCLQVGIGNRLNAAWESRLEDSRCVFSGALSTTFYGLALFPAWPKKPQEMLEVQLMLVGVQLKLCLPDCLSCCRIAISMHACVDNVLEQSPLLHPPLGAIQRLQRDGFQ